MLLGYVNVKIEKRFADKSILMKALLTTLSGLIFFFFFKSFELLDINSTLKGIMLGTVWGLRPPAGTVYCLSYSFHFATLRKVFKYLPQENS